MLTSISCQAIPTIKVHLVFDDGTVKDNVIAVEDLIDVTYNKNGVSTNFTGRVASITTVGPDPHKWYILVDGSGEYESKIARFDPMSILDLNILIKGDGSDKVKTPASATEGCPFLRLTTGDKLQYSRDGITWTDVKATPAS